MMGKAMGWGCTQDTTNAGSSIGFSSDDPDRSDKHVRWAGRRMDVFSQALKALALRPTHGAEEGAYALLSQSALNSSSLTENKRKHRVKKTDALGSMHKYQIESGWNKDSAHGQFWLQMEEYFREPTSDDIQLLSPKTKLFDTSDGLDPLFLMQPVGPYFKDLWLQEAAREEAKDLDMPEQQPQVSPFHKDSGSERDTDGESSAMKTNEQQSITGVKRNFLAASRIGKKKKLASPDPEIMTTVICPPENDDDELCHVCYGGDCDEQNQILFCDACNVAVHQECYGIKYVPDGQWLCSWCSYRKDTLGESLPSQLPECVLCPVKGGAVKPVAAEQTSNANSVNSGFAHLFCCQWIPETFIHDIEMMEPIMNVGGVRDERRKLLCSLCKERCGACIQCSHGLCATAFHPLCARQAKLRMEVSSKEGSDDIDLHAFCARHSIQAGKFPANRHAEGGIVERQTLSHISTKDTSASAGEEMGGDGNIGYTADGGSEGIRVASEGEYPGTAGILMTEGTKVELGFLSPLVDNCEKKGAAPGVPIGLPKCENSVGLKNITCTGSNARCFVMDVMDQTHSTTCDVALQMGISDDSLASWLQGELLCDEEVQNKINSWILSDSRMPAYGQLIHLNGRHAVDVTEFIQNGNNKTMLKSNQKDKLIKTYRNKRHKAEQKPLFWFDGDLEKVHPPESQGLSKVNDISCTVKISTEKQKIHVGGVEGELTQEVDTLLSNSGVESFVSFDEERRQRGLSGEASTCQDPSWTTQNIGGQPCGFTVLRKGRKNLRSGSFEDQPPVDQICGLKKNGDLKQAPCDSGQPGQELKTLCKLSALKFEEISNPRLGNETVHPKIHSLIWRRLQEAKESTLQNGYECQNANCTRLMEAFSPFVDPSPSASICTEDQQTSRSKRHKIERSVHKHDLAFEPESVVLNGSFEAQIKQLEHARKIGVLDMAPQDEVEEEILALQERLIVHAEKNQNQCERLILKVITNISDDLQASRKRVNDLMLVNQYLSELREAKKRGRKERRNKEAQAVLAAAGGAMSRRDSSSDDKHFAIRDSMDELGETSIPISSTPIFAAVAVPTVPKPLKVNTGAGRTTTFSRTSLGDKPSLGGEMDRKLPNLNNCGDQYVSAESREERASCDICSSRECSHQNKLIVCQHCKVVVHQDCYGVSKVPMGDWYCQPCSEHLRLPEATDGDSPGYGVVCSICFGHSGAFKRLTDGGWAHVFCAQWVPETTVGKDQTGMIEGLKLIPMERFVQQCSICHQQQGACLRCSFGHCHGAFHPLCARDSGLFMSMKWNPGGRLQYRSYCERHSSQQRKKAESRRCGSSTELGALMQMRVELERVRIICERICKRERVKRDRLNCIKDLYFARMSALPFLVMASNDLSATSNSLNAQVTVYKENSWSMDNHQDDHFTTKPQRMESESYSWNSVAAEVNRYQDSVSSDSVYQTQLSCSEPSRQTSARSHLGSTLAAVTNTGVMSDDQRRPRKHRKQAERLHTEVVMTPTEASVQNQRLPKGYAYVPVVLLSKGKVNPSASAALNDL